MSRPKQKWTSEEEAALKTGVELHKEGNWKGILKDPQFASVLVNRTNVDLKDKWRNMYGNNFGSSSRGNARTSCTPVTDDILITSPEPYRSSLDKSKAPPYKKMVYESLSYIDDPNGTDVNTMVNYLESKYVLQENFGRSFTANLRRLVATGNLEKVNNRYKVKGVSSGAGTSQQAVVRINNVDNGCKEPVEPLLTETLEDAASVAAFQVAVAETKAYKVADSCEDKNKLDALLYESATMLRIAEELHERCEKHGPITLPP